MRFEKKRVARSSPLETFRLAAAIGAPRDYYVSWKIRLRDSVKTKFFCEANKNSSLRTNVQRICNKVFYERSQGS